MADKSGRVDSRTALFILEKPAVTDPSVPIRMDAVRSLLRESSRPSEGALLIAEGVLQIPLNSGLPTLAAVLHSARQNGLAYRVLFFDDEPKWVMVPANLPGAP